MSTAPRWEPVDSDTADLLSLVSEDQRPSVDFEWSEFVRCIRHAADENGYVRPNRLRPLVRGVIAPKRIGAFTRRACAEGLIAATGEWETSDDIAGHNAGRPARVYRLVAA